MGRLLGRGGLPPPLIEGRPVDGRGQAPLTLHELTHPPLVLDALPLGPGQVALTAPGHELGNLHTGTPALDDLLTGLSQDVVTHRAPSLLIELLVVGMVSSQKGTSLVSSAVAPEASTHALPRGREPSWSTGAILRSWA